jgi:MFS family permease
MSILAAARISRAPIAALAAVGVIWGGFAALAPDIKAAAEADDRAFGLALLMAAAGGMAAMYLAPRIARALGRRVLPVAGVVLLAAFFYSPLAGNVWQLGLALFGMGVSVATLDITANMRISALEARHKLHLMNLNHAMFSFAFAGAAFATSLARKAGFGPAEVMPALALFTVLLWLFLFERRAGAEEHPQEHAPEKGSVPWGPIAIVAAMLFLAFICENATEAWSALHIERTLGGAHGEGGFGPMMLGLTMGVGRLVGQFVAEKVGEARLILGSAVLGSLGALVIAGATTPLAAMAGVGLLGFGAAVIVPSSNSILGHAVPTALRGFAIARAWLFGFTGFFIGPTLMGFLSDAYGLRMAFLAVALMMAATIPLVMLLRRREEAARA